MDGLHIRSPTSVTSETEEESRDGACVQFNYYYIVCTYIYLDLIILIEPQVLRIETKQAPRPSQPEVVLSDGKLVVDVVLVFHFQNFYFLLPVDVFVCFLVKCAFQKDFF